ncbi:MAG TPA: DUF2231 domain-containing protein [Cellulomonas sp.]
MDLALQVGGIPLHPLLVHAVVVLTPLTAVAVLLTQFWPVARRRLGVVTPLAALAVLALVPITVRAGQELANAIGTPPSVLTHEHYGEMLLPWAAALFVVAAAQWAWFRWRPAPAGGREDGTVRAVTAAFALASVVVAVGITWLLVLVGDSGARAVWGGVAG